MFQHLPGLEFCEDPVHTIKCELLYFDAVLYDKCTIYLDYHKWVLQNLDVMSVLLFAVYLAGLNGNVELYKRKKSIHFLGIFALVTLSYFFFCSYFLYVCIYFIFMSIFSCLIVHVLHSIFFLNIWNFLYKKQFIFLI